VKVTQILHQEDTENIIAPPRLLENLDNDQQMQCSFRENPLPNQNQNNSIFSAGYHCVFLYTSAIFKMTTNQDILFKV
jgi:hypothetical protein